MKQLGEILSYTPELDSELLDEKSKVLGVLAADTTNGQCLVAKGEIDKSLAGLATALSSIGATLEENSQETPTVVVDTEETQMLIKQEPDVTVVIVKKVN